MKEITITVKDGQVNLGVLGVKGANCKELTKKIEEAIGATVETQETGEYYEQNVENGTDQTLGGDYSG